MDTENTWKTRFEGEMDQAVNARQAGNEGMARVCARRAAGIAIGAYLERNDLPDPSPSAYDRLRYLALLRDTPADVKAVADHFLTRITADKKLPIEADLIADARWLSNRLHPEPDQGSQGKQKGSPLKEDEPFVGE